MPTHIDRAILGDPMAFAERIYGLDWSWDELNPAPEHYAAVDRLFDGTERAMPSLLADPVVKELWDQLNEAVYSLAGETGSAGVRFGAACEAFRATVVPKTRVCPDCLGLFGRKSRKQTTCETCNGSGVVRRTGVVTA